MRQSEQTAVPTSRQKTPPKQQNKASWYSRRKQKQTGSEKEESPGARKGKQKCFISLKSLKILLCRMSHKFRDVLLKHLFFYGRSTACQKNKKPVKMQAVAVVTFFAVY